MFRRAICRARSTGSSTKPPDQTGYGVELSTKSPQILPFRRLSATPENRAAALSYRTATIERLGMGEERSGKMCRAWVKGEHLQQPLDISGLI
jgi:hypothetical protein